MLDEHKMLTLYCLNLFCILTRSGVSFSSYTFINEDIDQLENTAVDVVPTENSGRLFELAHAKYDRHFLLGQSDCDGAELTSRPSSPLPDDDMLLSTNEVSPCSHVDIYTQP